MGCAVYSITHVCENVFGPEHRSLETRYKGFARPASAPVSARQDRSNGTLNEDGPFDHVPRYRNTGQSTIGRLLVRSPARPSDVARTVMCRKVWEFWLRHAVNGTKCRE